jgi:hypothetical protein
MPSLLDTLLAGDETTVPFRRPVNPFPRDASGKLVNPDYIQKEGQRIRDSLAAGTYGDQPVAAARGPGEITVAPASGLLQDQPPITFDQASWNQSPGQLRQQLKLDELRSTAALRKAEVERLPITDAYDRARLAHEEAATAAIGATNLRQIQKDATAMQHIAGFENYMLNAPEPGTPEYEKYVRKGIAKFPALLTTAHGAAHLPKLGQEHDLASLAKQLPEGFEITGMEVGGGKQSRITAKPIDASTDKDFKAIYGFPKSALAVSDVKVGDLDPVTSRFTRNNKGTHVAVTAPDGKTATMTVEAYEAAGGKYSGETAKARGAKSASNVKHLGTYNPETGNFE